MRFLSQIASDESTNLSDLIIDWWQYAVANPQQFVSVGIILAVLAFVGGVVGGKKKRR